MQKVKITINQFFNMIRPEGEQQWKELTVKHPWGMILDCGKSGSYIVEPFQHHQSFMQFRGWSVRYYDKYD